MFSLSSCAKQVVDASDIYLVEFRSVDVGDVQFYLDFTQSNGEIDGGSLINAYKENYNWLDEKMLTIFAGIKENRLIRIKGFYKDTLGLRKFRTSFNSPLGGYYFSGSIHNDTLSGELLNVKNESRGTIKGQRSTVTNVKHLRNYGNISKDFFEKFNSYFFDLKFLKSSKYKKFNEQISKYGTKSVDDLHFVFAFYFYARKLPYSHIGLWREVEYEEHQVEIDASDNSDESAILDLTHFDNYSLFKIQSFTSELDEMANFADSIFKKNPANLIVDLRGNPGGNIGPALVLAQYLVKEPTYGGYFLTRKFAQEKNANSLGLCEEFSEGDINSFQKALGNSACLRLALYPHANQTFIGCPIYVLVDESTASTCEPLVYGLKQTENVLIIGRTTAGKMLSSKTIGLEDSFFAAIPNADFITADLKRLDQVGVKPHVEIKQGVDILNECIKLLK